MRGKTAKKIRTMAKEAAKGSPELLDIYYKEAKKIYKKAMRAK